MTHVGALHEWARCLDARSDVEAVAELARHAARLDAVYGELCRSMNLLWDSPTGQVAEDLLVARTAVGEALSVLASVKMRFNAGEREIA